MISVVVACRGNAADIVRLLGWLGRQDHAGARFDFEVVVVDNNPEPSITLPLLPGLGMPITVIHEPVAGLSRARNAGIRHACGDIIAVTDPDSRPERAWLGSLAAAFADEEVICAGGRAVPWFAGRTRRIHAETLRMLVPDRWPQHVTTLRRPYWIIGCNMALRRCDPPLLFAENLGRVGRRLRSCEDLELVVRAQERGVVVIAPDAVVRRAVHPRDLRLRPLVARAFWHGVCIARLRRMHPMVEIYDSFRLRDLRLGRLGLLALTRIAGYRAECVWKGLCSRFGVEGSEA